MSAKYTELETKVDSLKKEAILSKHTLKNKDKVIADLESEIKVLQGCLVEYLQMENFVVDIDQAHCSQSEEKKFKEKKNQLQKIEGMLKTVKVSSYCEK